MSDNESLAYVFRGNYLCYSAYETRHIAFMWDVATDLRYIRGIENVATNALSRVEVVFLHYSLPTPLWRNMRGYSNSGLQPIQGSLLCALLSTSDHFYVTTRPERPILSFQRHFARPFSGLCMTSTIPAFNRLNAA